MFCSFFHLLMSLLRPFFVHFTSLFYFTSMFFFYCSVSLSSRATNFSLTHLVRLLLQFFGVNLFYRFSVLFSRFYLVGDQFSMSDTSTLVTVNTYESNTTASNPSLTPSRRGVAGSVTSNATTAASSGDGESRDKLSAVERTLLPHRFPLLVPHSISFSLSSCHLKDSQGPLQGVK